MKYIMKYIKMIFSFYNNCIEFPRQMLEQKCPKLLDFFYIFYFYVFMLDFIAISSFLRLFNSLISDIFAWFCFPIFIIFLGKLFCEDFFDK